MSELTKGDEPEERKKAQNAIADFADRTFSAVAAMLLVDGIHEFLVWLAN